MIEDYSIIDEMNDFLTRRAISKTQLAALIGVNRTALSQFMNGDDRLTAEQTEKICSGFRALCRSNAAKIAERGARGQDIIKTADANGIMAVCKYCQDNLGLGLVYGASGFGKTYALKYYSRGPRTAYIECNESMNTKDLLKAIERALALPRGMGTTDDRLDSIKDFFNANPGWVLIIDEADKLITKYTQKKAEVLRSIFDESDVGLVLAGEPALAKTVKTHIPRLANRVDIGHELTGLAAGNVREYLSTIPAYEFDEDAERELLRRAVNGRNGCFRLFVRTVNNVIRMRPDGGKIGLPDVEEATRMMII